MRTSGSILLTLRLSWQSLPNQWFCFERPVGTRQMLKITLPIYPWKMNNYKIIEVFNNSRLTINALAMKLQIFFSFIVHQSCPLYIASTFFWIRTSAVPQIYDLSFRTLMLWHAVCLTSFDFLEGSNKTTHKRCNWKFLPFFFLPFRKNVCIFNFCPSINHCLLVTYVDKTSLSRDFPKCFVWY